MQPESPRPLAFSRVSLRLGVFAVLATASGLLGQTPSTTPAKSDEPTVLSSYQVRVDKDEGYRASNSVSATRIDTPIKDLPLSIEAFTEEFVKDIKPRDLLDIVSYAPGVSSASGDFAGGNNGNYNIRGFATGNPLRNGFKGPNVVDPVTIARVEVVRGPSSLLYGQLPPGGAVNYITKQPLTTQQTTLMEQLGNYDAYRVELDSTGPIDGGTGVYYRFNAAYDNTYQYYTPSKGRTSVFSPVLQWRTARSTVTLDYQYFHRSESPSIFMTPFFVTPGFQYEQKVPNLPSDFNALGDQDHRTSDTRAFTADWHFQIEDWEIRASYALARQSIEHFLTATLFIFDTQVAHPFLNRTASLQTVASNDQTGQFEGLRKIKFSGGEWQILAGYQTEHRTDYFQMAAIPAALAPAAWDLLNPATWNRSIHFDLSQLSVVNDPTHVVTDNDGLYLVNHVSLFQDKLGLLAGLRYSDVKSVTVNEKLNSVTGVPVNQHEYSPQAGVIYKLLPELSAYASYSESFVPTGGSKIVNGNTVGSFDPTKGKGFDLGLKSDFLAARLSISAAYFQLENQGIVNNVATGTNPATGLPVFTTFQSGIQASKGVELSGVWSPTDTWQVLFSYSYLNAYVKTNLANLAQQGAQLSNTAHEYANLWTKYTFKDGTMKGLYLAGGINYTGKRLVDISNQNLYWKPLPLLTLSGGYSFKFQNTPVSVELTAKNLTNETYFPTNNSRGYPRLVMMSLTEKF